MSEKVYNRLSMSDLSLPSSPLLPTWAPKVPRGLIQRLYETDARGLHDSELIAEVGWALWHRCESILTVTEAHNGRVRCPACQATIQFENHWEEGEQVCCASCGWQAPWASYHQTYQGKQLFGANAVEDFKAFHAAFPKAQADSTKMLLIDQLIHAFHLSLDDIGRPAAANLLEGSLKDVIHFLDSLTAGETSAAGLPDSRLGWRKTLTAANWVGPFLPQQPQEGAPE